MKTNEQIIKALETCSDVFYGCKGACSSCSFSQTEKCFGELVHETIKVIKGYERVFAPMKPVLKGTMWECPVCHHPVGIYRDDDWCDYCPQCGKAMQWTENKERETEDKMKSF